jgi:hypothetical protein
VILRCCLLLVLAWGLAPLRGQESEPIHMRPEFPLIFPLTTSGETVTVKYPVLINGTAVVKPGMQLRVLYVLSQDSQNATDLAIAHAGALESSYARSFTGGSGGGEISKLPPEIAHEIEGYRRTVWTVPNNFILAMAQYPTESMHLIYSPTGRSLDLDDEMFRFFDGLFVGAPGGKVTVVAVEKASKAEQAGIKAGDEIISVGAYPTRDDLTTFANAYAAAKKDATENEVPTYAMALRGADGATRTANIGMPLRLRGGLMDGFSDKP